MRRILSSIRQLPAPLSNDLRKLEVWANEFDNRIGTIEAATGIRTPTVSGSTLDVEFVAGTGMSGGGFFSDGLLTFNVGAGTGITVNADTIELAAAYRGANPTGTIGLAAVNGSATSYMRSDGAPPLSQAIVPTWTGIHTFTPETVHNGGVDLGTSGRFDSNVVDGAAASSFLFRPTVAQTSGADRYWFRFLNSSGTGLFDCRADGTFEFGGTGTTGGYISIGGTVSSNAGFQFTPTMSGAGATQHGWTSGVVAAQYQIVPPATPAASNYIGAVFGIGTLPTLTANITGIWGGGFRSFLSGGGNSTRTISEAGGWKVWPINIAATAKNMGTVTAWYGGYVSNSLSTAAGAGSSVTNAYGIYLEEQTRAATVNNGILFANATAGYKAICIRDQSAWIGSDAAARIDIGATNFLVQSTSIGFFNVTPAARPSAYTQTYSTATKTHSNLTSATLTDSTGGTANTTLVDVGIVFSQAAINDNFADVAAQINALIVDITNVKGVLNSVIDDDQILGLKQ